MSSKNNENQNDTNEISSDISLDEELNENTLTLQEKTEIKDLMESLENKLDGEIGNMWWKVYIASAFWSNISTPINLSITLLSAVTAGQAATSNMLSQNMFVKVSVASLLISTLNTFFRPHAQYISNMDLLKKINEYGFEFENIHYSKNVDSKDYIRRYKGYKKLMIKFHRYKNTLSPEQQNFLTDLIYYICKNSCLRNDDKWLDIDKKYIQDEDELKNNFLNNNNHNNKTIQNKQNNISDNNDIKDSLSKKIEKAKNQINENNEDIELGIKVL